MYHRNPVIRATGPWVRPQAATVPAPAPQPRTGRRPAASCTCGELSRCARAGQQSRHPVPMRNSTPGDALRFRDVPKVELAVEFRIRA